MFRSSNSRESAATSENILKQLADYEVTILMDDSGSMYGAGWRQVRDTVFFLLSLELTLMVRGSGEECYGGSG